MSVIVEGIVHQATRTSLKIGERGVNVGKYFEGELPKNGAEIHARVADSNFLEAWAPKGQPLPEPKRRGGGGGRGFQRSPEEERRIVRQCAVKAAVDLLAASGGVRAPMEAVPLVKQVAEELEQWIYR